MNEDDTKLPSIHEYVLYLQPDSVQYTLFIWPSKSIAKLPASVTTDGGYGRLGVFRCVSVCEYGYSIGVWFNSSESLISSLLLVFIYFPRSSAFNTRFILP